LFDNYFQMSAISIAVRNRKHDFKNFITEEIKAQKKKMHIMNLACGSCRDVAEMYKDNKDLFKNVSFDCYDNENQAFDHAKTLLGNNKRVNFIKENALRLSATTDIKKIIGKKYDIVYSMGLFDYLNYRISVRLVRSLKKLLKKDGLLVIADVRDRYFNPSVHFMEWVGSWSLIYRDDRNFKSIFLNSGFTEDQIQVSYEQQGVIQYILAKNS